MRVRQTKVTVVTPRKKYLGVLSPSKVHLRTSDLLNNPNLFPRYHDQTILENALRLHNATELIDGRIRYKKHDHIDIIICNIIFFYDEHESLGNAAERERAKKALEQQKALQPESVKSYLTIDTSIYGNSFFEIKGVFFGRFRNLMKQNFVSLTNAKVKEKIIQNNENILSSLPYKIRNSFVAVNTSHIASYSIRQS